MNRLLVSKFGISSLHLESGVYFSLIQEQYLGEEQFAETRKITGTAVTADIPLTLDRNQHIVFAPAALHEVAATQDDLGGMTRITLERSVDWPLLTDETTAQAILETETESWMTV